MFIRKDSCMPSISPRRLRPLLIGFNLIVTTLLLALAVITLFSLNHIIASDEAEHQLTQTLSGNMADARFHVVQIQQFLTDASATGDRDGFKDAAEHYAALQQNLQQIATIAPDLAQDSHKVGELSQQFYQVGKTMAETYISQGREA
ncbi:hypothetical protein [Paludibacterium denitrificans]|uniref:Methyl-accepting chemotaxis protein n=1 Tax=Paludibacterium denitrificans TaxID=2675226 RepID=A0A844GCP9_9NEIS|nr:hypothetical protein [Paludibacterium denitrificans]MTD33008.1 hypothetical protein [Paludibacterium denitrificans]